MRKISILVLMMVTAVSMYGCAKSDVEKQPVTIEDTVKNDIISVNTGDTKTTEDTVDSNKDVDVDNNDKEVNNETTNTNPFSEADEVLTSDNDGTSELVIEIEGMKETIQGKTHKSTKGYSITYDVERFKYTDLDGVDQFIAENPDPELYPYVYLNISKMDGTTTTDAITEIKNSISKGYESVEELKNITIGNDYNATGLKAKSGTEWNSSIREYYVIQSGNSSYIIEMQYFLEAAEGFGTRMHAMLDTFELN
ncbi:MAG: hypothetical protein K0S41_2310 [Anaerocolumna sp.]|jgi:hypothetical protein|nr:hypothetical protein [Anaerocolumna sp.]